MGALNVRSRGGRSAAIQWTFTFTAMIGNTSPKSDSLGTVRYSELNPEYYRVLHELNDFRMFKYASKRYVLESVPHELQEGESGKTFRQFRAIDGIRPPVPLVRGRHSAEFGIADDLLAAALDGVTTHVTLHSKLENYTPPDEFEVAFNGNILPRETRTERAVFIMDDDTWITFPLSADLVNHGKNNLEVIVWNLNLEMAAAPILTNLEVWMDFDGGLPPCYLIGIGRPNVHRPFSEILLQHAAPIVP